jgi:hypothetical protein
MSLVISKTYVEVHIKNKEYLILHVYKNTIMKGNLFVLKEKKKLFIAVYDPWEMNRFTLFSVKVIENIAERRLF